MFNTFSIYILPLLILLILTIGMLKKVPIYEEFINGAKDGFNISVTIIPYLVAIIVAVTMFKASGAIEIFTSWFGNFEYLPKDVIPVIFTRSLSGSATLGIFSEIASSLGPDNYATKLAAVMVGSSETTFYVLSVYFGSVGIKKYRYALLTGVIADGLGILFAIYVSFLFFK